MVEYRFPGVILKELKDLPAAAIPPAGDVPSPAVILSLSKGPVSPFSNYEL